MQKSNYKDDLKKVIDSKQLVEIDLSLTGKLDHFIAYILDANDDFLTVARISNDLTVQGVTICRMSDVETIQTETGFVKDLSKGITDDSLLKKVKVETEKVKNLTFGGFISAFENTKTIIEITTQDDENFTGRIVNNDNKRFLILDEYFPGDHGRFARTYINPAIITSFTVGGTWLETITRSVADQNL
jgi:hypothetical protein